MNEALQQSLYDKLSREQDKYRDWLKGQPPEEILHHSYEYTVREDILMSMEELTLSEAETRALLLSPSPMAILYDKFSDLETGYMDTIRDSIEDTAKDEAKKLRELPVYPYPADHARENGELDVYRASFRANVSCKDAIEAAIRDNYRDNRLDTAAVGQVAEQFGQERMLYVLAATVRHFDYDGRLSRDNKRWANTIPVYPAYGYKRDPKDKHHLVIDEETAPTVRRIFSMRASGMGFRAIAVTLNEEGVLPPGALYYQRKGRSDPRNVNHKWAETTVKALIRSEVYIGNMVQGKTGTLSYKSRKLINKPEEEWIRVEGTHEPIISREVWDTVVSIDKKKVRKTPPTDGIRSIFTGLVYCADCGFKMRNHIERFTYKDGTPGRYSSFICGNYARSGKSACTIHSIYENVLEELVLTDIREKARFVEVDGVRLAEQISRMKEKESRSRVISYEQELKAAAARVGELERLMQNLYEDKCTGAIPQTVFQTLMRKYETERAEKASAIPELEQKVRAQLENRQDANRWMEAIRRYTEITVLDESILFELVDRIEVGEARKVNGQRICDVKVVYRYVGSVDDALSQERLEAYEKAI